MDKGMRINYTYVKKFVDGIMFSKGKPGEVLPEAYRKFWREWKVQKPEPVHYIPEQGKWKRNPLTGEVSPVQDVPIPLKFPKESHEQLWGGEGVVQGFQKRKSFNRRVPHFWMPTLKNTVVYSEILNKYMSVVVTDRTMSLIHKNYGFDHYILKTPACELQSHLALKLKRKLLSALLKKNINYEDAAKKEIVFDKYKQYLKNYTEEEIEWYGLTFEEALAKYQREDQEHKKQKIQPLKHHYRFDLVKELLEKGIEVESHPGEKTTWLSKINPFHSKKG